MLTSLETTPRPCWVHVISVLLGPCGRTPHISTLISKRLCVLWLHIQVMALSLSSAWEPAWSAANGAKQVPSSSSVSSCIYSPCVDSTSRLVTSLVMSPWLHDYSQCLSSPCLISSFSFRYAFACSFISIWSPHKTLSWTLNIALKDFIHPPPPPPAVLFLS